MNSPFAPLKELEERVKRSEDNPLLGLEDLLFIFNETNPSSIFRCMVCIDSAKSKCKQGNLDNILIHFQSGLHQFNYLKLHFHVVYEKVKKIKEKIGK